jgi:ferredoxin-NADP reductase
VKLYQSTVDTLRRLSDSTVEIVLTKPQGFDFSAGQRISCVIEGESRDYSLACSPADSYLVLCVRQVMGGKISGKIAKSQPGDILRFSGPHGYFVHRPGKSVFMATGTGIAPFVAFCRSGFQADYLLHGVRTVKELYYRQLLEAGAEQYIPCCTEGNDEDAELYGLFHGRVTEYLEMNVPVGCYNFYLCGNGQMVRDGIRIIDKRFPGSKVFSEMFFSQ